VALAGALVAALFLPARAAETSSERAPAADLHGVVA
jgi:hypothetical protein